uniref:Uncharacterized protein n=1 Tax=Arundo donax TaxID=35708 RepID=A0A0A9E3Y6_ARUDO
MYRSAMEKFNNTGLEFLSEVYDSLKTSNVVCNKDCIAETKREACNHGKEPLVAKDSVLPPCTVCVLLRQGSIDHCNEPAVLNSQRKNPRNVEAGPPLDAKVKRTTRNSSRLAKEQNVETHAKTRICSSKRIAHAKAEKVSTKLNCKNNVSWSDELSADALVSGKASCSLDGIDCNKDDIYMFGCWNCILIKSLNSGCIQNILQFRWNCVRRCYHVPLLLKTGTLFLIDALCYVLED